ncbi:response regulator transcription factor [Vibrio gallicus]|uniref:response regulator transcription factor n=1 Tax=Vibrio gallicus TaxID=190897 RepID=UPI0021C3D214|nr:response regulator [Vibrio gallicus]
MLNIAQTLPVYVVDDDESVRDSLLFMLEGHDFDVKSYADGQQFLDSVDIQRAGCVILDSRMPKLRGQQVHQVLKQANSPLAVIFLTGHGDVPMAVDSLKAGAVHFFQKPVNGAALIEAINDCIRVSQDNLDALMIKAIFDTLTARERDILQLIVEGKRNLKIADELCIATRTVEVHRASLMKKLNAKTVAELTYAYGRYVAHSPNNT